MNRWSQEERDIYLWDRWIGGAVEGNEGREGMDDEAAAVRDANIF
jgi:hypothetical protein